MSLWPWTLTYKPLIQAMSSLVIDWLSFVYGPTHLLTNMCKAIYPNFFEGGHENIEMLENWQTVWCNNNFNQDNYILVLTHMV